MSCRLAVLGSTGSVGNSTLRVVRAHPDRLSITALAARGRHLGLLADQVREFRPQLVAVADETVAGALRPMVEARVRIVWGNEGLDEVASHADVDRVVAAMVGAAGLPPLIAALEAGKDVALANKESLVVAGRLVMSLAAERRVQLLPVDSEHVALHQALRCGRRAEVHRLTLTASGGPFRDRPAGTWHEVTPAEALRHPTWNMGEKISVDSATLVNKGLELIEASHLFEIDGGRIDVVIHPQSLVHSLVEFCDGSLLAQLSANDMVLPVQYALSYPERWPGSVASLRLVDAPSLEFVELDGERFPAVALARDALQAGDSAPAVFNAVNEVAVEAFLDSRLPFPGIVDLIEEVLGDHRAQSVSSIEEALEWNDWGRRRASEALATRRGVGSG